ncbi:MAG: threonylcarbamoyl-AMP synthase [Clostridia bacterium]|nr:threonylcarbamoyl-AMP synthase [Clostridia bacterium]
MTKVFDWQQSIDEEELKKCIETINKGGLVIFPTETVYGIGANAYNEEAVRKIYEVKMRPDEKPLSIMVSSIDEISKYAIISNEIEEKIIKKYMPGPITIVLKKKPGVFDYISSGKNTIGIRIPDNEIILKILKEAKLPIVAPSANISGKPSGIILSEILKDFDGKVDICIDGGKAKLSEPSTIVKVVDNKPVILRQGRIKICI